MEAQTLWDEAAATFDDDPDHGLRDPLVRKAWQDMFSTWLPAVPLSILDIGCGTGSLSVLLASLGHTVTGLDFSAQMLVRAKEKARVAGYNIPFFQQDAANPQLGDQRFDAIVCRHLLWALPQPDQVLQRWVKLLQPGGKLILIEGYWHTGAGLHAQQILDVLPKEFSEPVVHNLTEHSVLWSRVTHDERYAVIADAVRCVC